ncbi:hypothetical protein HDV00_011677 [Rhizophlyctis rosea]|nr:hypothetical protein HDV00_011677 [Rhizophlyctis rosea]
MGEPMLESSTANTSPPPSDGTNDATMTVDTTPNPFFTPAHQHALSPADSSPTTLSPPTPLQTTTTHTTDIQTPNATQPPAPSTDSQPSTIFPSLPPTFQPPFTPQQLAEALTLLARPPSPELHTPTPLSLSQPRKELTHTQREAIALLHKHAHTPAQIAKLENLSISTVRRTLKRLEETGSPHPTKRSGRPKNLNEDEQQLLLRYVTDPEHCKQPVRTILSQLEEEHGIHLGPHAFYNYLKVLGVKDGGRTVKSRPTTPARRTIRSSQAAAAAAAAAAARSLPSETFT